MTETQPDRQDGDGLRTCPCCAGAAAFAENFPGHIVACENARCGIQSGIFPTKPMARRAWNTRPQPTNDAAVEDFPNKKQPGCGPPSSYCTGYKLLLNDWKRLKSATPKPAPDAMRVFGAVVQTLLAQLPSADVAVRMAIAKEITRKVSAPVPSPDGALDAHHLYFSLMGLTSYVLANFPRSGQWNEGGVKVVDLARECIKRFKRYDYDAPPSGTGAAEPVAWPDHPGATVDAVAFVEGVKRYPNMDRDAPDLTLADKQAACQGAFINGFKRAMEMCATPPVRGGREAIEQRVIPGREDWFLLAHELSEARDAYLNGMGQEGSAARRMRLEEILWNDKGTFIQVLQAMALSLPVQPGAGEREADVCPKCGEPMDKKCCGDPDRQAPQSSREGDTEPKIG